MFRLLSELKDEILAWVALSRRGRARAAEVLGLDEPAPVPELPPPGPPPVDEPAVPDRPRRRAAA